MIIQLESAHEEPSGHGKRCWSDMRWTSRNEYHVLMRLHGVWHSASVSQFHVY